MKRFFIVFLVALAGVSCLKNQLTPLDYSGIQPTIITPDSNWPNGDPYSSNQDSAHGVTLLHLKARISYATPLNKDVKVSFKKDATLLDAYNAKWSIYGLSYTFLPDSCYQVGSLDLTIPAGTQQAEIPITLFPAKIGGYQNYLLGFTITDGGGFTIGSNEKSMIFTLSAQ
jgi:uncharacterized protein DUF1735